MKHFYFFFKGHPFDDFVDFLVMNGKGILRGFRCTTQDYTQIHSYDCREKQKLSNLGKKRSEETKKKVSEAKRKSYSFQFEEQIYNIDNLKEFCKERSLDYGIMTKLHRGAYRNNTYKGWSACN